MRNAEVKAMQVAGNEALVSLLGKARLDEKKDQHWSFAQRLAALALHAQQKEYSAAEVIELLRKEAEHFEHSSQEIIV
ncbi:phage-related protein [Pectobacterium atrosepticum SCRI1043]|uniref:Phage-related protein n=1 Tax=Pectobacterium atrosepticum (strain SCRI 1043 / ATCC BAA-672) TaxID=218491 RepID=Q6D3W2_PECAS|nr:DUF2732 domain-containing protein [Pectobacterium atrosepticum]AIK13747.1 phage-related protein [Pectobacterium atrosepticum]MCL6315380.1 DUF2732 domain-containing protein [Pectobacterium atrosepticum]MCL6320385.1 DUF2732 domain-containing protein [Pectobacterium atrosepticum]CAG75532.1 phage-related protein [Pectobacterium atrosepticum SCRI1043]